VGVRSEVPHTGRGRAHLPIKGTEGKQYGQTQRRDISGGEQVLLLEGKSVNLIVSYYELWLRPLGTVA